MIANGTPIGKRYVVQKYIASGGMQDVYKASDRLTGLDVALKTPQAGQKSRRFKQSAQLASRVNHYNVAKTTDYFEIEGSQYLIEELVEGDSLEAATLGVANQIDPHLAAHLFMRIAKGVCASHTAGVAHRDLKPGNILVRGGQKFQEIKLTDFGIATIAEELFDDVIRAGGDFTKSTSGTIQGALPYMAPEMMFRRPGDKVGTEADIWAVGAMMFRLMTGIYPFGEAMMVPVNVSNNTREPWPAFLTSNAQFAPLSQSLQAIIELCLQRDPRSRPTASQLVSHCEKLCYSFTPRVLGIVSWKNGARCKIDSESGTIFFHTDSVYGPGLVAGGARVIAAPHPGSPHPRAHPVVLAR